MTRVTYTGGASVWRSAAYDGLTFENGETKDVDEAAVDWLTSEHDFEHAADVDESDDESEPEFGVLDEAIDDLENELDAGDHDDHLVALRREEENHKNRSGALEAIDDRRSHVAESGDESDGGEE